MANYRNAAYFESRPDIVRLFDDLEAYHDWCRFEMCEFNPAHLGDRTSALFNAFLASKRPRRPYLGNKPRFDNPRKFNNDQSYSR